MIPVNICISHARYVFWNAGGLGWSIGKRAYLESGSYWHKSGADSEEPWQVDWEKDVIVKCHDENGRKHSNCKHLTTSLHVSPKGLFCS